MRATIKIIIPLVLVLILSQRIELVSGGLRELCDNDKLTTLIFTEQLKAMIGQLNDANYENNCSPEVKEALVETLKLIDREDWCSMNAARAITNFIDKYPMKTPGNKALLPKKLSDFVISFGQLAVSTCKQYLTNHYAEQVYDTLREDFQEISELTNRNGPIGRVLRALLRPGEIILLSDLRTVLPEMTQIVEQQINTLPPGRERLREICVKRLQPIYEPLALAIAHLVRAGFNFQYKDYTSELKTYKELRLRGEYWSRVVLICEHLKTMGGGREETVVDDTDMDKQQGPTGPVSSASGNKKPQRELEQLASRKLRTFYMGNGAPMDEYTYDPELDVKQRLEKRIAERSWNILEEASRFGDLEPFKSKFKERIRLAKSTTNEEGAEFQRAMKGLKYLMQPSIEISKKHNSNYKALSMLKSTARGAKVVLDHADYWTTAKILLPDSYQYDWHRKTSWLPLYHN